MTTNRWNGWDTDPIKYTPVSGKEVQDDGTVFDVPAWRSGQTQTRNSQTHLRAYNPDLELLLKKLLAEQIKTNEYLALMTDTEL